MSISYHVNGPVTPAEVADLLRAAGFTRPLDDSARVQRMLDNADLVVTVRDDDRLVGYIRCLTDFAYYCLVAELAVLPDHQRKGIGRDLLQRVRDTVGEEVHLVLNASETGDPFYAHLGWEKLDRAWRLRRTR